MLHRSHRGGVYDTPENTMPAFLNALQLGYDMIETDPRITKDGVVVLMHDPTLNRTCRNPDGSRIENPLAVSDLTYEELLQYDAGIAHSEAFRGTRVPRLDELLKAAQSYNVSIALDKTVPTERLDEMLDVVLQYKTKVTFSTSNMERIQKIQARIPDAAFDFDVNLEDEMLQKVCRSVCPENLMVWMYLDKPNYTWLVQKAKVSPENYARVKAYARVGIANIHTPTDVREALGYCPDAIEF